MDKKEKKSSIDLADIFEKGFRRCPSTDALFSYLDGEKTDPTVEHHIKYCPLCRKEFEFMKTEFGSYETTEPDSVSSELERQKSLRDIAYRFIKKHFPEELDLFDIAWRVFKDILPEDFKQEAVGEALGIVGEEAAEVSSSKVIVLLNHLHDLNLDELTDDQLRDIASGAVAETGCSRELVDQVIDFIISGQADE